MNESLLRVSIMIQNVKVDYRGCKERRDDLSNYQMDMVAFVNYRETDVSLGWFAALSVWSSTRTN